MCLYCKLIEEVCNLPSDITMLIGCKFTYDHGRTLSPNEFREVDWDTTVCYTSSSPNKCITCHEYPRYTPIEGIFRFSAYNNIITCCTDFDRDGNPTDNPTDMKLEEFYNDLIYIYNYKPCCKFNLTINFVLVDKAFVIEQKSKSCSQRIVEMKKMCRLATLYANYSILHSLLNSYSTF